MDTIKFLFFTDSHIRGTNPKNRKDDFYETLKNKFNEIKELILKLNVDYVIHGGDWFDRPDISPSIVREFAIIIKSFERPVYTVAGNHDIFGQNPDTVGRTMLGLLEGTGIIKLLSHNDEILLDKKGIKVQIRGSGYSYNVDGEDYKKYYIVKKREDADYAINIVHGMLLQRPFYEGVQYTLLDDILETEADITFAGHYHSGFGVKKVGDKYFINPGSIVRVSTSISEISRKPEVVLLELGVGIKISEIELKTALPGDEVLDRESLMMSKDRDMKLHQFYQGIAASGEYKKIDLEEIISNIASNEELSDKVREEAIRRIAIARESFDGSDEII